MTSYVPGAGALTNASNQLIEQRVTNYLLQQDQGKPAQEDLRTLRNDFAQSLGIFPPVVPGD